MSTIEVNKITPVSGGTATTLGDSGDTFTVTSGATFNASSSNLANRPNSMPLIVNGSMAVAQRGTSSTGLTSSAYNTVDRFKTNISGLGTWTETQESLTSGNAYTDGFSNALKIDCTTADASPAASDRLYWSYRFEGQDVQLLKKGTANAEKVTVAFWIKATKTGTNILELYDNDNSRAVSTAYTVSASDTWEHKVVNFPADTTGALGDDNGGSLYLFWYLGAGSNYTSGTLQTTWASSVNANRVVGQVNHGDSTSNNVHITGVQMEVGEFTSATIPPFQHESYGDNLQRCLRYFQAPIFTSSQGVSEQYSIFGLGTYTASGYFRCARPLSVEMRTNPSLVSSSGSNYFFIGSGANDYVDDLTLHADSNFKTAFVYNSDEASGTAGQAGNLMGDNASAYAWLDAEL